MSYSVMSCSIAVSYRLIRSMMMSLILFICHVTVYVCM
jgi:hypothetical protein